MKKRIISFLLSVSILLSLVFSAAPRASAAYDMKATEKIITLIKDFEGFTAKPYQDNGQWSVGYGSAVSGKDLTKYQAYGITDKEADALLRKFVAEFEEDINTFAKKYGLKLSQQQFDALISFTYNLGPNWMNNDSAFRQAVLGKQTGNDFLFAITRWCTSNDVVVKTLAQRRLMEANVYLNGVYSASVPSNYRFCIFNNNIEAPVTNAVRIQGYDTSETQTIRATPTKSGYRFLGWYTKAAGGEWVSALNASVGVDTLYAHWQKGNGDTDANGNVLGVAAKYERTVTADSSKIVRNKPMDSAAEKKKLKAGDRVTIVADYMDGNGEKWGKLSTGGWLNLTGSAADDVSEPIPMDPMTITVIAEDVNIRCGPGTDYYKTGKFYKGEKLVITATQKGGQYLWGQSTKGWVCLHYTDYDMRMAEKSEEGKTVTATGVIVKTSSLNVRNGPGTRYEVIDKYSRGDRVEITVQQKVGSATWGLTQKGWISLYYVELTPVTEPAKPEATEPDEPTAPESTEPEKKPESEKQETPEKDTKPDNGVIATGTVYNCNALNVRSAPGIDSKHVGRLKKGERVEILEQAFVKREAWGRTKAGWICLTFVKLDAPIPTQPSDSETASGTTSSGSTAKATGIVVKCSYLNVRAAAGVDNARVTKLAKGTKVTIYETKKVNSATWGRIDQGWVHLYYIQLDAGSEAPSGSTGGTNTDAGISGGTAVKKTGVVVKTDKLRVRSAPGVDNPQVGTIAGGTKVLITETVKVGSTTWGRIDKGWISLYYVKLDSGSLPAGAMIGTVTTSGLRIRSAAGTDNPAVGSYDRGDQVVILEQTTVDGRAWGRTDKGWISMHYVD